MFLLGTLELHSKCPQQFLLPCALSYPLITFETNWQNIVIPSAKCSQCAQWLHAECIENVLQNVTLMFSLGTLQLCSKCSQQFLLPCTLSYPPITFGAHWQNIGGTLKIRVNIGHILNVTNVSMCLQCSANVLQMLLGGKIEYMGVKTIENILNTAAMYPVKTLK